MGYTSVHWLTIAEKLTPAHSPAQVPGPVRHPKGTIARASRMRQAAGVDMLTVVAVAAGIPVAAAMMVLALVTYFGRRARESRRASHVGHRPGGAADVGSTRGGMGSS